jgi:hypothetical protein
MKLENSFIEGKILAKKPLIMIPYLIFLSFFSRDILRKIILRHLSLILFVSDENKIG